MSTNEFGEPNQADDYDTELSDWASKASQPNWIKWLRYEKRDVLCLADIQVAAIKQLTDILFESRAIIWADLGQQSREQQSESNRRLADGMHFVRLMCLRGLLTDRQEAFFIRTFHRNGKPAVFLAMKSRSHRHYLGVDEKFWATIKPAIKRAAITTDSKRGNAYRDKCDEVAFACMSPAHRRNWELLKQCPPEPSEIPSLPTDTLEATLTSVSPILDAIAYLGDDLDLDQRRPATRWYPSPRTQRELLLSLVEVVRQGHAWIAHRTDGPFLIGDKRNERDAPVAQTQRMFISYAEKFVCRGILRPDQEDKFLEAIGSDAG